MSECRTDVEGRFIYTFFGHNLRGGFSQWCRSCMVSCRGVADPSPFLLDTSMSEPPSSSSSWTLISSSESPPVPEGTGLTDGFEEQLVVVAAAAAYDRDSPAKRAAAEVGTSERNALCSPPINNGVDAVTNDAAWAAATAAAAAWACWDEVGPRPGDEVDRLAWW